MIEDRTEKLESLDFKDFSEKCEHNVPTCKFIGGFCDLQIIPSKDRLLKNFDKCVLSKCPLWNNC